MIPIQEAIDKVNGFKTNGVKVLGFDGLTVLDGATVPSLEHIADFSGSKSNNYETASKILLGWLEENEITHVDFVVEENK